MSEYIRNMPHDVTYWPPSGTDKYGKTTFDAPVAIRGRWEDKVQVIQAKDGSQKTSMSRVAVSQPIDVDGFLFLGTTNEANPKVAGAKEIQAVGRQPDLRGLTNLNIAYL